ncbi:MAG TPA: hypothetical protein VHG93_21490 [Longimicrobium sp.]|nr:hypothetical protein [Longimicrobium sp.]
MDSLVAHWLHRGAVSNWQPHLLLEGCPRLAPWQRRGLDRLLAANLSRQRVSDLALAWAVPLGTCNDERVEQWYIGQLDAAVRRGDAPDARLEFWIALQQSDSPRIRDYLRSLMLDAAKPEGWRHNAGAALFAPLNEQERMREYLAAFETRRLPFNVAVAQTELLLRRQPEALLRSVAARVRINAALADQTAFTHIVESSGRYASPSSRRALGQALREGMRRSATGGRQRIRLEQAAAWLERSSR